MSIETIDPAQSYLDELTAGLLACAREAWILSSEISVRRKMHTEIIYRQIGLSEQIGHLLNSECINFEHKQKVKGRIAEELEAIHKTSIEPDDELQTESPILHLVQDEP